MELTDPGVVLAIAREQFTTDTPTDAQLTAVRTRMGKVERGLAQDAYADAQVAQGLLGTKLTEWRTAATAQERRVAVGGAIAALDRMIRQLTVVRDRLASSARRIDEGGPE